MLGGSDTAGHEDIFSYEIRKTQTQNKVCLYCPWKWWLVALCRMTVCSAMKLPLTILHTFRYWKSNCEPRWYSCGGCLVTSYFIK